MADDKPNPKTTSADYDAMAPFWHKVNAVLGGADALRSIGMVSVAGPHLPVPTLAQLNRGRQGPQSPYLPRFENETPTDYELRRTNAPLANIYADISSNLSSKPFSKLLELDEGSAEDLKRFSENIDGMGNNLHVFARDYFKAGLDKAVSWILIDFTNVPAGVTLDQERRMGARPYWVHIPAERLLAVYSTFLNGTEVINHARIYEPCTERDGYGEKVYERVRVFSREPMYDGFGNIVGFSPATWELWEEEETNTSEKVWVLKNSGPVTIGIVPLVPFRTGRRDGVRWCVTPPLRDLVNMQVDEFQQESGLKTTKEMTAFPMLSGEGIKQPTDAAGALMTVPVGPRSVLFAPMDESGNHGRWSYVEPGAQSLTFLETSLEKLRTEMRDLGMQPLTVTNITIITSANVSAKAHNAVQAWALGLKDSLEQAWKITCMWLGRQEEPTVRVHTDFGVEMKQGTELDALLKAEGQSVLSKKTVREEFKRRSVLGDDYDEDEEEERLAEQQQGLEPEQPIDPRTGLPLAVAPPVVNATVQ